MTFPVKWFHSEMAGIPQLTRSPGELVALLDAVLVNGFNLKSVTSITRVGTTATVNFATAHGFLVDQVITIAGADQAEYNGEHRVAVVSTNYITFTVAESAVTPSTGTVTCKASPLGFDITHTATNRRVYRTPSLVGSRPYLRVENDQLAEWVAGHNIAGRLCVATEMLDINTPGGDFMPYRADATSFPTAGWANWYYAMSTRPGQYDSTYPAATTPKSFAVVGDHRSFYFLCAVGPKSSYYGTSWTARFLNGFGEFLSYKANDPHRQWLCCHLNYLTTETGAVTDGAAQRGAYCYPNASYAAMLSPEVNAGQLITRNYTGYGYPCLFGSVPLQTQNYNSYLRSGTDTGIVWPNYANFGLLLHPLYMREDTSVLRGLRPGVYAIHNNVNSQIADKQVFDNVAGYPNRKFLALSMTAGQDWTSPATSASPAGNNASARLAFDLTGPWVYE